MTPSLILRTLAPPLLWLLGAVSLYILFRGHNEPGGGFIGGLIAAIGVVFYAIVHGRNAAQARMRIDPAKVCALGLLVALGSGLPALAEPGVGYLTHRWWTLDLGIALPVGTALLFDLGVYFTVIGAVTGIFLALVED